MAETTVSSIPTFPIKGHCIDFESTEGFYFGHKYGNSTGVAPGDPVFFVDFSISDGNHVRVPISLDGPGDVEIHHGYGTDYSPRLPHTFELGQHVWFAGDIEFDFSGFPLKVFQLSLHYIHYFGVSTGTTHPSNLMVNGYPANIVGVFADLPDPFRLGGVEISVRAHQVHVPSGSFPVSPVGKSHYATGEIIMNGQIESIKLGSAEFGIDQVCLQF